MKKTELTNISWERQGKEKCLLRQKNRGNSLNQPSYISLLFFLLLTRFSVKPEGCPDFPNKSAILSQARRFPRFLVKRENFLDFKSSEKVSEIKPWAPVITIQVKRVSQILSPSIILYNSQNSNQGTEPLLILKRLLPSILQRKSHSCIPFLGILLPQSQFLHLCVCERFILSYRIGPHISCSRIGQANQSWEYINRSQTQECENWNCGRAQFLFQ